MSEPDPIAVLTAGVESYTPWEQSDGELWDPLFEVPTQYATAYHAWGHAALARHGDPAARDRHATAAITGIQAVLHLLLSTDPSEPWAGFDRSTAASASRFNHTDFTWPAVLRTLAVLDTLGTPGVAAAWQQVAAVPVPDRFYARPPSNWAMVWLVGEWRRIVRGLSPYDEAAIDAWLEPYFAEAFDEELGLYVERGVPNAYDLFTRVHLTELLACGYRGTHHDRIRRFLGAGVQRSLAMQLSDGSLASGFRSTAQTWTLGAQVALFTWSAQLGLADQAPLAAAAWRSLDELARWQRPGGTFSPVQNLHPPHRRIGYESYTVDANYASLALGFLASAIDAGLPPRPPAIGRSGVRAEQEPTFRAVAHAGRISVAVQAAADGTYDGTGIVDVTFGAGARLALVSSTRHLAGGPWFNPGLGLRAEPHRTPTVVLAARAHHPLPGFPRATADGGVRTESLIVAPGDGGERAADGSETEGSGAPTWVDGSTYTLQVIPTADGIDVVEGIPGTTGYPVLFLPYPRDLGGGVLTFVEITTTGAVLRWPEPGHAESLELVVDAAITGTVDLDYGYENRRGSCGLLRFDLAGPADTVSWHLRHRFA